MIAGVVPIDLLALERKRIYEGSKETGRARASADARMDTLMAWQTRWADCDKAKWTRRLIKVVRLWEEGAGEVNFFT